jgi:hypothetical protein
MESGQYKKKKASILIASLLIHVLILLFVLHDYQLPSLSPTLPPQELPKKNWAERNPGRSHFGAPVVFRSTPTTPQRHQKTATKRNSMKKENSIKSTTKPTKKMIPHQAQKSLTMVQLLQGYLEQKGTGSDVGLKHKGSKKQPPDEQIKYERYAQKIHWCIQNAFKINKRTLSLPHAVRALMQLHIEFKDNGTVKKVQLITSSGSAILDQFMIDLVQYAGSSFPPIPNSFDKSLLPHSYSIAVDVPATTGSNMHMSL